MVARPIHNLKVAGSNLEGGNIFSERYLARKVCEERKRKMESVAELQRRKEYGKKQTFLKFQLKTRKLTTKSRRYYFSLLQFRDQSDL